MLRVAWGLAFAIVVCLAAGTAALAQEGIPLGFHFAAGEVAEYQISFFGSGSLSPLEGGLLPMALRGSLSLSCTVSEVFPDGSGRLHVRVPRAEIEMSIGQQQASLLYEGQKLRWYANGREHAPPEMDFGQVALLGRPLVFRMAPNGRVTEPSFGDSRTLGVLGRVLPQFGLSDLGSFGDEIFPDEPVKVGETWRHSQQLLPFGPAMPVTVNSSHTLVSFSEEGGIGLAKIVGYREAWLRTAPMDISSGEREVMVSVPELRRTVTSTEFFNTTQGRLVRGDYQVGLSSQFSVGIGEEERKGEVEGRIHITVQAR